MFGRKKPEEKTFLLLDVESGSVAGALVRLAQDQKPKLFGEKRVFLPVAFSISGSSLAHQVEKALKEVVQGLSELAARLRLHPEAHSIGRVEGGAIFFAPPWGKPDLEAGKPAFMPDMSAKVRTAAEAQLGRMPLSFYTSAGLAAFGARALFNSSKLDGFNAEPELLFVPGGEISELLHMDEQGVRGHATIPLGEHALLRTLRTHASLSELEARSAARLPFNTPHLREPFAAAAAHLGEQFTAAVQDLLQKERVQRVRVVGNASTGEWFARALSTHEPLDELFPHGGEIRAVRIPHLTAHIAAHQEAPDLRLMLAALFVDSRVL